MAYPVIIVPVTCASDCGNVPDWMVYSFIAVTILALLIVLGIVVAEILDR